MRPIDYGKKQVAKISGKTSRNADIRDCVYGMAVGDALGVPFEFRIRGSFRCSRMVGGGAHRKPAGTWSDDTSMALAICDSYRTLNRIDCEDIRRRFLLWYKDSEYTVDGLFDIGNATSRALELGRGMDGELNNGNGSLMRTAVMAFMNANDDDVREVSAITHAHETSTEACVRLVQIARRLTAGEQIADVVPTDIAKKSRNEIQSSGFVLHTEEAALWCLANTETYADCVLTAVNLGEDSDTTACVAGALAGIAYGKKTIPANWIETLRGKDIIERCLF